ncbi:MAG TPA: DsbA family protein [Kofleriaceae bacterium]|jgi:2-hydroxychromene-2-carboxylate isomerase
MIIAKRLKGKAISAWLGTPGAAVRRTVAQVKSKLTNASPRLDFYFDVSDPWSYLGAQILDRLVTAYGIDFSITPITSPATDVNAQPRLRTQYALRDAQELAEYWNLEFPGKRDPDGGMVEAIGGILIRERPAREQLTCALELGQALWSGDKKNLVLLQGKWGVESQSNIKPVLNTKYTELRKAGHYQGAMFQYGGNWYWGIDRLMHLEEALAVSLGRAPAHVVQPRAERDRGAKLLSKKDLSCEMWFSFRSPYSYLALQLIEDVLAPYDVPLQLKQVPPMVTRGIPLPTVKKMYIVHDVKREADRLGIPFGDICDPLGVATDNCLAIQHWANARGIDDALAFAKSATKGAWSEARDLASYVDLRFVVERAGLPWDEAKNAITNPASAKVAIDNAAELDAAGLWGVPSYRVGDFVAWGQDRLPLLVDRLRRHQLAAAEPPATDAV